MQNPSKSLLTKSKKQLPAIPSLYHQRLYAVLNTNIPFHFDSGIHVTRPGERFKQRLLSVVSMAGVSRAHIQIDPKFLAQPSILGVQSRSGDYSGSVNPLTCYSHSFILGTRI